MKHLDSNYYVEVKDHRYKIHPTENIMLRKRDPPHSLRTQDQVQNETQIRKNQKSVENNGKLKLRLILKINKQLFNINKKLNHQIVLAVSKIID